MIIIEEFNEFVMRQGCEYVPQKAQVSLRTGEQVYKILFANGAVSDGDRRHRDPPNDPRQLLQRQRDFVATKLQREVDAFEHYRGACMRQAELNKQCPEVCMPAPANAPTILRQSQQRILKLREELAALDDQLVVKEAVQEKQEMENRWAELWQQQDQLIEELGNIQI